MVDPRKLLEELELSLLSSPGRTDKSVLDMLIADDFAEAGASGATFGKREVLAALPAEIGVSFSAADLHVKLLAPTVGLVTYTATRRSDDHSESSRRCSIWQLNQDQWQLVYHQGTKV